MKIRTVLGLLLVASSAMAQSPAVDAKADAALKAMGQALSGAKTFTFTSHSTFDTFAENGQKVQVARTQQIAVKRPDAIASVAIGDDLQMKAVYDGKQVILHNTGENSYALAEAPATIDATLDMLANDYGLALPLADVLFADPYKTLIESVRSGAHLGTGYVFDTKCDHLAFRQDTVDWQVWIEQGEKRLPRKIVITYKDAPGSPQFTAYLSNWNLAPSLPADQFKIVVPAEAKRVDLVKVSKDAKPAPAKE